MGQTTETHWTCDACETKSKHLGCFQPSGWTGFKFLVDDGIAWHRKFIVCQECRDSLFIRKQGNWLDTLKRCFGIREKNT